MRKVLVKQPSSILSKQREWAQVDLWSVTIELFPLSPQEACPPHLNLVERLSRRANPRLSRNGQGAKEMNAIHAKHEVI